MRLEIPPSAEKEAAAVIRAAYRNYKKQGFLVYQFDYKTSSTSKFINELRNIIAKEKIRITIDIPIYFKSNRANGTYRLPKNILDFSSKIGAIVLVSVYLTK